MRNATKISETCKQANKYFNEKKYERAAELYQSAGDEAEALFKLGVCYNYNFGVREPDEARRGVIASEYFFKAATLGHAEAQCYAGLCCLYGIGVEKSADRAAEYFEASAENGCPQAMTDLGYMYENGYGNASDAPARAFALYQAADAKGDTNGTLFLGLSYLNGYGTARDYEKAGMYIESAGEAFEHEAELADCARALTFLGEYYENADAAPDIRTAFKCYLRAACIHCEKPPCVISHYYEQRPCRVYTVEEVLDRFKQDLPEEDYAKEVFELGQSYDNDPETVHDDQKAFAYYLRSAQMNYAKAQYFVGKCFRKGRGVAKDEKEAVKWYKAAADNNYPAAYAELGDCYETGAGVGKDVAKAIALYEKGMALGSSACMTNLGYVYLFGVGVDEDAKRAAEYLKLGAERNHTGAQFNYALLLFKGEGVEKDYAAAAHWFEQAAESGEADAQYMLGYCYYFGMGVPNNYTAAFLWFHAAAEQGDAWSQCFVGQCYKKGHGVRANPAKAKEWYSRAAAQGIEEAIKALKEL